MENNEEKYKGPERRKYIRWSQIAPIRLKFIDDEREIALGKWRSGVAHNISATGVCLEIDKFEEEWKDELISGRIKILLEIQFPGLKEPILVLAKMVWLSKLWKEKEEMGGKYIMGLSFMDITVSSQDAIRDYILKSYAGSIKNEEGRDND